MKKLHQCSLLLTTVSLERKKNKCKIHTESYFIPDNIYLNMGLRLGRTCAGFDWTKHWVMQVLHIAKRLKFFNWIPLTPWTPSQDSKLGILVLIAVWNSYFYPVNLTVLSHSIVSESMFAAVNGMKADAHIINTVQYHIRTLSKKLKTNCYDSPVLPHC